MLELALVSCSIALTRKISRALPNLASCMRSFENLYQLSSTSVKFDLVVVHHPYGDLDEGTRNSFERYLPPNTPAIVIISEDHLDCAVQLLNAGVDRCLPASFDQSYFSAVARALIRRSNGLVTSVSQYGVLSFNHETKRTWVLGNEVELTKREGQVLEILLKRVGKIIAKKDFVDQMDPDCTELNESAVEVYVHRLRKKINSEYLPIRNIKRCGYFLRRCDPPVDVFSQLDFQSCY
ncbi:winged helix-turn-helix domain-containing protein [Limnohabitans sp.]|uniref:winged helix-turn-helix domain-containing protein n=1 Tax=Limnohabitans sp. TaxID=1907725 RepID=UPI00286EC7D6|nr:winged helix-turn-helix domain-containing protein [Limnohabitans sp.]